MVAVIERQGRTMCRHCPAGGSSRPAEGSRHVPGRQPAAAALRAAEDAEDAAEADAAMDEPGESVPWEQGKAELCL